MSVGAYLGVGVAARLLGVTRETAAEWVRAGILAGTRVCRRCGPTGDGCKGCRYYVYREPLMRRLAAAKRDAPHFGAQQVKETTHGDKEKERDGL